MIGDDVPDQPTDDPAEAALNMNGDEQALSECEQTLSDGDQTLSDADQTNADRDQASADSDQLAADQDQVASDHELAAGGSERSHDASRDARQRTTRWREQIAGQREQTAQRRLDIADQRDSVAHARDLAALARDQAAAARDLAMAQLDADDEFAAGPSAMTGTEIVLRAAEQRRRAARYRVKAAAHRASAAEDRQLAARDRERAARERQEAFADRDALARALEIAAIDELTGARTRAAGLTELEHEVDRCRRSRGLLVVVYVDVVGLKMVNDTEGHAAGDELLKRVVALIKAHMRSYDLIIRVGGDEFLCAMSDMSMDDARGRFGQVARVLASTPERGAIRTGFAKLAHHETAAELIARADRHLLDGRASPAIRG